VTSRFQPNADPRWTSSPSFEDFPPGQRFYSASAVVNSKLYVMGGASGSTTNEVWSFDPSQSPGVSSQWKSLSAMPGPRSSACAASFDNRIYLFGGRVASTSLTRTVFVFDPSADPNGDGENEGLWIDLGDILPQVLIYCAAAQAGNEFIFITAGTQNDGSGLSTIYRFKPDRNGGSFEPFDDPPPSLITARYGHTATTINGKIVIAGGFGSDDTFLKSVEMFDPESNTISSLPDMNVGRRFYQASALDSTLFVSGGQNTQTSFESLFLPA